MSEDNNLHLADLIQSVKQELIASSVRSEQEKKENGTPYLLELEEVELELKFYVKTTAEGKVNILVSSGTAGVESAKEQTARIKFKIHKDGGNIDHMYLQTEIPPENSTSSGILHATTPPEIK
ncbi:MAG: hypothetical protein COA45_01540 [Zetaproteobacteria bacterium]|nr:MAG: hypothetical protein COA45_01540 [Zetaproteobacteria bacterium]